MTSGAGRTSKGFAMMFYGANRAGAKVSQGILDQFWLWSMQVSVKSIYECIKAFSETDFTEDPKKFDVPAFMLHGEDDQVVPVNDLSKKSAKLIGGAQENHYSGPPHGVTPTDPDRINVDLLEFLKKGARTPKWLESLGGRSETAAMGGIMKESKKT